MFHFLHLSPKQKHPFSLNPKNKRRLFKNYFLGFREKGRFSFYEIQKMMFHFLHSFQIRKPFIFFIFFQTETSLFFKPEKQTPSFQKLFFGVSGKGAFQFL